MPAEGLREVAALRIDGQGRSGFADQVVAETPVALLYNGQAHAVMMATPADLADFALGFALGEGIVADPGEFALVDQVANADGIALHAAIPQHRFDALEQRRRSLPGRSGCGLCGVEDLRAAIRPLPRLVSEASASMPAIAEGLRRMAAAQRLNQASGGVHAAAFVHAAGLLVREDVGRHNALDKLVGARAVADPGPGFLLISSRASYEMVHKAASAGIAILVAVSAPTDLAIRVADQAGLTLIAFARGDSVTVYTHAARLR